MAGRSIEPSIRLTIKRSYNVSEFIGYEYSEPRHKEVTLRMGHCGSRADWLSLALRAIFMIGPLILAPSGP